MMWVASLADHVERVMNKSCRRRKGVIPSPSPLSTHRSQDLLVVSFDGVNS